MKASISPAQKRVFLVAIGESIHLLHRLRSAAVIEHFHWKELGLLAKSNFGWAVGETSQLCWTMSGAKGQ